jgi:hypothetical protein
VPGKIFISYRRDDAAGDARGIRDALARAFGKSNVFMDVDNLLAGQRFDKELEKALSQCDVLIAVIGPRWMELLPARAQASEGDYVRDEIAAALKRGIVVIPVRVGQEGKLPPLPRRDELPDDIRNLLLHQRHDVTHERFRRDVADLAAAISIDIGFMSFFRCPREMPSFSKSGSFSSAKISQSTSFLANKSAY